MLCVRSCRKLPLHLAHFEERARQSGDWEGGVLDSEALQRLLENRIVSLDFASAKQDVLPFIQSAEQLDIWSQAYFLDLIKKIVFS